MVMKIDDKRLMTWVVSLWTIACLISETRGSFWSFVTDEKDLDVTVSRHRRITNLDDDDVFRNKPLLGSNQYNSTLHESTNSKRALTDHQLELQQHLTHNDIAETTDAQPNEDRSIKKRNSDSGVDTDGVADGSVTAGLHGGVVISEHQRSIRSPQVELLDHAASTQLLSKKALAASQEGVYGGAGASVRATAALQQAETYKPNTVALTPSSSNVNTKYVAAAENSDSRIFEQRATLRQNNREGGPWSDKQNGNKSNVLSVTVLSSPNEPNVSANATKNAAAKAQTNQQNSQIDQQQYQLQLFTTQFFNESDKIPKNSTGKSSKALQGGAEPAESAEFASSVNNDLLTAATLAGVADDDDGSAGEESGSGMEVFNWPEGRYGLPKSIYGCPKSIGFRWKMGFRYHDTEDDGTENQRSDVFHLAANFSEDGISHEFCIKDSVDGEGQWPDGKYCIYKRGPVCPVGLTEGFVVWDDENVDNQNDKGGSLPEGLYNEDTKIYFCCSNRGKTERAISLPANKPFFLFAYDSIKCQKVHGMRVNSEFIKFDDEDHGNMDFEEGAYPYGIHKFQKDHMLFLCYYEPENPEYLTDDVVLFMNQENREEAPDGIQKASAEEEAAIKESEALMKEFLSTTGGEEDETNKSERTEAIIKTIKVSEGNPLAVIVGFVCAGVLIGVVSVMFVRNVLFRPRGGSSSQHGRGGPANGFLHQHTYAAPETAKTRDEEEDGNSDREDSQTIIRVGEQYSYEELVARHHNGDDDDNSSDGSSSSRYNSDFEEDEELVEDQLLPDSELKSGLELLFLKQQRHYWNQRKRHDRSSSSVHHSQNSSSASY